MSRLATDYGELRAKILELEGSVLTEVIHQIKDQTVRLHFKHWDGRLLTVQCDEVLLCNVSAIDLHVGESEVIGARLEILEEGSTKALERAGYLWETGKVREQQFDYPMVYLSVEGDICLAVVSGSVHLV